MILSNRSGELGLQCEFVACFSPDGLFSTGLCVNWLVTLAHADMLKIEEKTE